LAADTADVNDNAHNLAAVAAAAGWWCRRCLLPVVTTSLPVHDVRVVGWERRIALGASSQPTVVSTNLRSTSSGGEVGWRCASSDEGSETARSYIWALTSLAQTDRRNLLLLHTTTNTVCT
jgi:hypothetical protein